MRRMTAARRGGFTLVELLTVMAIVAVLAALSTAAFFLARKGTEERASEGTVSALRGQMESRWKTVLDDARDDAKSGRIPAPVVAFAGGDKDRALAVWSYCKLKNEFPTTVAEACNPVFVPVMLPNGSGGFNFPGVTQVLAPKSVFAAGFKAAGKIDVQGLVNPTNPDPAVEQRRTIIESAACLHWSLTTTATRGAVGGEARQQVGELSDQYLSFTGPGSPQKYTPRAFQDSFGQPVTFLRHGLNAEVNDRPYTDKKPIVGTTDRDPLDPRGTLVLFGPAWSQQHLAALWTALYPRAGEVSMVDPTGTTTLPGTLAASQHAVMPDGTSGTPKLFRDVFTAYKVDTASPPKGAWNWVPTIVSAGADRAFGTDLGQGDDILSYRLAREGNRGN